MQVRRGKQLPADTFPEAILNGAQLDLNALYRAVCARGGFATGIGVNWAGQVCSLHLAISALSVVCWLCCLTGPQCQERFVFAWQGRAL